MIWQMLVLCYSTKKMTWKLCALVLQKRYSKKYVDDQVVELNNADLWGVQKLRWQ